MNDAIQRIADAIFEREVLGAITDQAMYGVVYRDANGLRIPAEDVWLDQPVKPSGPLDHFVTEPDAA
jgi:hypothetical protein